MAIYAIDFDNTLAITRFPEIVAPMQSDRRVESEDK